MNGSQKVNNQCMSIIIKTDKVKVDINIALGGNVRTMIAGTRIQTPRIREIDPNPDEPLPFFSFLTTQIAVMRSNGTKENPKRIGMKKCVILSTSNLRLDVSLAEKSFAKLNSGGIGSYRSLGRCSRSRVCSGGISSSS